MDRGLRSTRLLVVIGLTALYAVCFVVIKAGLAFAPPLLFAGLRTLLGGIPLLGIAIVLPQPWLPARQSWRGIIALALTATTLTFGTMFLSPGRAGAGIASVMGNMQPLFTVILAAVFLSERITPTKLATILFGLAGVALISFQASIGVTGSEISGIGLALTASAGAAIGNVIYKRIGLQESLLVITSWQLVLGSLPLLALSLLLERGMPAEIWNLEFMGLLFFLAFAGTSLLNVAWYWLVRREDVGQLSTYFFLVPVFGLVVSALIFSERITPLEMIGCLLVVAGVGLVSWESQRRFSEARSVG